MVRVCGRKGGRWNINVKDMAPRVTKSKLEIRNKTEVNKSHLRRDKLTSCVFVPVPAVLPTDGVTVLWMLREGDVDADQRRAVL